MPSRIVFISVITFFCVFKLFAQQGIHGPKVVTSANTIVNEYTSITAYVPAGSTTLPVAASSLNANNRFAGPLVPGDLIMIYQVQGAIIKDIWSAPNPDTTWGKIVTSGDYYSTGRYEFHQVSAVPNSTSIVINCATTYDYIPNGATARKPMVIRVPRYTTLTINSAGVLTCDDWAGTLGGVLAVEVQGNTVINAGGLIDLNGKGFRGGSLVGDNNTQFGSNTNASTNSFLGAEKGEGVAGYQAEYDAFGGRYCRAPGANGGGGGCAHNGGGGGGANAPNSSSNSAYWSGNGIPDQTTPGWTTAWNLEAPMNTMSLRTSLNSAGGGRGGYSFSSANLNALTVGPSNASWGGDYRNSVATGLGGRPLDYSTGRLFFGGGGGAGDQNNLGGGVGGDGGGLCYLMVFGGIAGSGTISANGLNGLNGQGGTGFITGIDGAGGGGAGGAIILNAVTGVANTITVNANGGNGGDQVINLTLSTNEGEGPGGGGSGGYIAISSGTPIRNSNGGLNGTTNSAGLTEFIPNGATKGCPGTNNATITNFTINVSNITICVNNSVTLTATLGGSPPANTTIYWYAAAVGGNPIFTGPSYTTPALTLSTTYWVATCPGWWRVPLIVTVSTAPTVTASASLSSICIGSSTTLTGAGAITYTWNPGNLVGASVVVSPAVTTTYTVTGTVVLGCTNTATITITVNPIPTVTAAASLSPICNGGSSTLTGVGATSYVWNPGNIPGSPIVISPTATTTYTVTGTSLGCSNTAQVTVVVNAGPTVTAIAAPSAICAGGSSILTVGGAATYVWNPGNIIGASITVSPLTTTTYTVTGTASNGCINTQQVTVTVNPLPVVTATATSPIICLGASTVLTGGGAATYVWNPGNIIGASVTVSPIATTTYTVTGTASNGCVNTQQVTVTVNPLPVVTATASSISICFGGSVSLTGGGAATYVWNPGNISGSPILVSPTATTTYTVTGTDAFGCTSTSQVIVVVNSLPLPTAIATPLSICIGQSVSLVATGGVTYTWNGGNLINATGVSQTDFPNTTSTYSVNVTDINGCTATAQVTVNVNPLPIVNAGIDQTICSGNAATIVASGGGTYLWNGGSLVNVPGASQTVLPTNTTTYIVNVTDVNGCVNSDSVNIFVNPNPTTAAGPDVSICPNSSCQLLATGAVSYLWSPSLGLNFTNIPNPIANPLVTTVYVVTGTNSAGCTFSDTIIVTVSNILSVFAGVDVSICSGDSVLLSTSGGVFYSWTPAISLQTPASSSTNAFPAATTTYTVQVTDSNSCSGIDSVTVFVNPAVFISVSGNASICAGQAATLTANPIGGTAPYNFNWSNNLIGAGPHLVVPITTTTYTVSVTDSLGCTTPSQSILVTVNPLPILVIQSFSNVSCYNGTDGTATVLASGGNPPFTYAWTPVGGNASTASGLSAGSYTVTVTSIDGCIETQSVILTQPTAILLTNVSVNENCINADGSASVAASGGNPGYTYLWSNLSTNDSITNLTSGNYSVTVTDANGCTALANVSVGNSSTVNADAGVSVTIIAGQTTVLNGTGGVNYSWSPPSTLSCTNCQNPIASPTITTTYTVTVSDAFGCFETDTVTVFVDILCGELFIPNAFSPNGDNANDTFYVRGNCIKYMDFQIYNRWGEKVFYSNDQAKGWDGIWRGEPCESATFTYFMSALLLDGSSVKKQGTISLVK